ncbi:MAG TPA: hypothetical protein VKV95_23505 [Terriglobia bacterium]|nr:hypothetical protein [Terriglobia bacterium]
MKKAWVLFVLCIAVFACPKLESFASVTGSLLTYSGPTVPCGSGGTLYRNLTSHRMNFELELDISSRNINFSCSSTSVSWVDAQGHPQTLTVNKGFTTVVATSLPPGGTMTWVTPPDATQVGFIWVLQRDQATGASSNTGEFGQCGSSGSIYSNLTNHPIELNFAVSGPSTCQASLSWTDTTGHTQTLDAGLDTTEGVSTSLPANGTITWTTTEGIATDGFVSYVEQVPDIGNGSADPKK